MPIVRRLVHATLLAVALAVSTVSAQQPPSSPDQQTEFVPVDPNEVQEQLPAAPMLIAAYSFALVAIFLYILSIAKRLGAVKDDIARLEGDLKRGGRV